MSSDAQAKTLTAIDFHGNEFEVTVDKLRWRPSVYAIVIRGDKVLLARQANTYTLPGGGMEFGEMPEDAVVRETFEETGIRAVNPRLVACKSNVHKSMRADNVEDFVQAILLFYRCDYAGGKLSIAGVDDHEQTWTEMPEWVPLTKVSSLKRGSSYEWDDIVENAAADSKN